MLKIFSLLLREMYVGGCDEYLEDNYLGDLFEEAFAMAKAGFDLTNTVHDKNTPVAVEYATSFNALWGIIIKEYRQGIPDSNNRNAQQKVLDTNMNKYFPQIQGTTVLLNLLTID